VLCHIAHHAIGSREGCDFRLSNKVYNLARSHRRNLDAGPILAERGALEFLGVWMDNFLSLGAILMIVFGLIGIADGAISVRPMIEVWQGVTFAVSGVLTYVFAEILTVLKDIRKAVTRP
jgi:hypothetical protein